MQEGVDELGYILTVGHRPLQPVFQTLVADVLAELSSQFKHLIHGIYLYGSVARGDAVAGRSDLDLTLVLLRIASPDENRQLEAIRYKLQAAHPEVVKIDFDIGILAQVTSAENLNSWGFWFKHHCCCIWGDDLATRLPLFKPSRAIALAVNGDFYTAMDGYTRRIETTAGRAENQALKRAAARKLIRATNILRSDEDTSWPQDLDSHVDRFLKTYPAMADPINYLLSAANGAHDASGDFVARLRAFADWLRSKNQAV